MQADPLVSVIVPVYNERHTISEVLRRLRDAPFRKEIIVVDDHSDDGTWEILQKESDISLARHDKNSGKGSAIRTGIAMATGDIVIIQDADLEYDPTEIPEVIRPIVEGRTTVSYGNRFSQGLPKEMPLPNKIANRLLSLAVRILYRYPLQDEATCYKAFEAGTLKQMNLTCTGFEFCPEVTAKSLRQGIRIVEVSLYKYRPRTKKGGKKIRWTDGVQAFWTLIKQRFGR
ncbi:MAG: glycosyltransferase family 2 protein [Armatimonadetes bacterium]|nr:glycosyltransferase family 2 protein [Armatimonadota bacterium]